MTFYKWLKHYGGPRWVQTRRGGAAVGDLRLDVLSDNEWPQDAATRKQCEDALGWQACDGAREALRIAWQMYRDDQPKRKGARSIGLRKRFAVLERDGFRCCICGATAAGATLEVDHKVSVAHGGSSDASNLWALCFACNRGKHAQSLEEGYRAAGSGADATSTAPYLLLLPFSKRKKDREKGHPPERGVGAAHGPHGKNREKVGSKGTGYQA